MSRETTCRISRQTGLVLEGAEVYPSLEAAVERAEEWALANGATSLMFEGVPSYPDSSRFWQVIDKHQVNIFYTAPTALRALMREGHGPLQSTSRASLRLLGSVGEPINPEAWDWYFNAVGEQRCPIVDTWWQTETGATLMSPLPGASWGEKEGTVTNSERRVSHVRRAISAPGEARPALPRNNG